MDLFESAHNATYYSKAYSLYRDAVLRKFFAPIMTGVILVVIGIVGIKIYKKVKSRHLNINVDEGGDE